MLNIRQTTKEFFTLIKLHFIHNWQGIALLPLMVVAAIPDAMSIIEKADYIGGSLNTAMTNTLVAAFSMACLFYSALATFSMYKRRTTVHSTLLLPTSNGVKFLTELLCSAVLFPLYMFGICYLFRLSVIAAAGIPENSILSFTTEVMRNKDLLSIPTLPYIITLVNSLVMLEKSAKSWMFRALLVVIGITTFILIYNFRIVYISVPSDVVDKYVFYHQFDWSSHYQGITISTKAFAESVASTWITRLWILTVPIAAYIWAYYRFKERTI